MIFSTRRRRLRWLLESAGQIKTKLMELIKRNIVAQCIKLGCSAVVLVIGSCMLFDDRDASDKSRQTRREQVELASGLLEERGFLTRKEFVSICKFGCNIGEVSYGKPHEGRIGVNETWAIEDGMIVKTSGYSSCDQELGPRMIDKIISGDILDDCKIFKIWIFDKSGKEVVRGCPSDR